MEAGEVDEVVLLPVVDGVGSLAGHAPATRVGAAFGERPRPASWPPSCGAGAAAVCGVRSQEIAAMKRHFILVVVRLCACTLGCEEQRTRFLLYFFKRVVWTAKLGQNGSKNDRKE